MKYIKQYEIKKVLFTRGPTPKFKKGDKVYATDLSDLSYNSGLKFNIKYTINKYQIAGDEIYYELVEINKPNNFLEFRFSTPEKYYQIKYNI